MTGLDGIPSPSGLEPSAERMRDLAERALARIVSHIEGLPSSPVSRIDDAAALARSLREPLPEAGEPADSVLETIFGKALARSFNTASPGYLAYIPGGGLFESALAEWIAASVNRYSGVWIAAPGLVEIEANVLRWFCQIVGYPDDAFGLLTSGGSMANLIAIAAARHDRLGNAFHSGVIYASDQVHHCVQKAAIFAGLRAENVRLIDSDDAFRLRVDRLEQRVLADRHAGLEPFLVVSNAGSTNTGAIDDLCGLAALARAQGLWNHVDAAYGGFFALTARGRAAMRGIELADSIVLDPHKGLFLPYGTGCLLVRRPAVLRDLFGAGADYMPPLQDDEERVDFCLLSPELSRPWRGLRVWLPFKLHGAGEFRRYLNEKLDLAAWAHGQIRSLPGVEVIAPPELSLFAFRHAAPGLTLDEQNSVNRRWLARINARQRVFLTGTMLGERFALRLCVLSFRTHGDRVKIALDDIVRTLPAA